MNSENELMQKLMISKKIMDKHNNIERGQSRSINMGENSFSSPMVEDYQAPSAKYNIPQEFMGEQKMPSQPKAYGAPTEDRIVNSKLPEEIKKLMIEHPIQQPNMGMSSNSVLSNELVEKASRLMKTDAKGDPFKENGAQTKAISENYTKSTSSDIEMIRQVVRETVEEVLSENGLLIESESKSSDMFKFRVGQHLFEGKVLKIKKMSN
jgi:hypothetical protein